MLPRIESRIAQEIGCRDSQVLAAIQLLDEGATVPFIARYRKEATDSLDDTQLRTLEERLTYLRDLEARRTAVLESVESQGKLTPELRAEFLAAATKAALEDLYLPYKPKLRSKAQVAREAGLAPLATLLLTAPNGVPADAALAYVNPVQGVADTKAALEGARHILMEQFSEDAQLLGEVRTYLMQTAEVVALVEPGQEEAGAKFADYFDYREPWKDVPSHRALALFRGRNEGILKVDLGLPPLLEEQKPHPVEARIAARFAITDCGRPGDAWLKETVRWTWKVKLGTHLKLELFNTLRERAEAEAIRVFGANLRDLLLAAPAGPRATIGLDPGLRTGVKVAVVDATGKLVDTATIFPHEPRRDWEGSLRVLAALCAKHRVELMAIGNGTASRETEQLGSDLVRQFPDLKLTRVVVSEAGASVYSASELAAREFPKLDVSLRGAVSIARRLQDPLAELVKVDPKSIGVGQYQHDVAQTELARALDAVVEDCVNAVGVDLNTASTALLARVAGLNTTVAANIVAHRDTHGAFANRTALLDVARLGAKTYEQCAGFLRIRDGAEPLDASAVHPEAYPLVQRILADIQRSAREVIGDPGVVGKVKPEKYADAKFGIPTINDILKELVKPGRDVRPEFRAAKFADGIHEVKHLQPGMVLEGKVTNVAAFGAFVDIGVHQDGLVHISNLSTKFVKDPRDVVKAGEIVKVKVLEVDVKRGRVQLTMRLSDVPGRAENTTRPPSDGKLRSGRSGGQGARDQTAVGAMAAAFAKIGK
jgi:protein Tex